MSRSGYSDCFEESELNLYRGTVTRAIRGKRGQALLRDCLAAMDEMPVKRLIPNALTAGDDVCLLGAGGRKRAIADLDTLDPEQHELIGLRLNIAPCLVAECEYVNDEMGPFLPETPEARFVRVRKWLVENIAPASARQGGTGGTP